MTRKIPRRVRRVGVATTDWSATFRSPAGGMAMGGAGWVRFGQVARRSRHHVVVGHLVKGRGRLGVVTWDGQTYMDCDVLFIQRYMDDWLPDSILRSRADGQVVVNDVDDWFWGLHPENAAAAITDPSKNRRSNTSHYRASLEASTVVTVSTPFLLEKITAWGVPARLIQNCVTCTDFSPRYHGPRRPILGWTGSTAHRSGDLSVLADFAAGMKDGRSWHHTGHHPRNPTFSDMVGIPPERVGTTPMLPPWEYPNGFVFDIGTVPLVDIPFNHAKSFIKGIEYVAAGIPFVASPLAEYARLRDDIGIGRLAATPGEWLSHIAELADPITRREEASANREVLLDTLDVRFQTAEFDQLVQDLCG